MFKFNYKKPKVIAEIGCNHMGDIETAKELILLAKKSGVEYVKFQKRNNIELLTEEQYSAPHPVPENSYGDTYGAHREYLEFTASQHHELMKYCITHDMIYSTSVWDVTSAREIAELQPEFIKVPSACNNNYEMLKILRDVYNGQVQVSMGMTTLNEVEDIISFFELSNQAQKRLVIYACTSGYPVPPKDVSLLEINKMYGKYGKRVHEIGFSGHHLGVFIDISAYTLGASWIERHFTKDTALKGTDHSASLEPEELHKLVQGLHEAYLALTFKESEILTIEKVQRDKLKYREK
jgi:sialic acid synthase